MNLSNITKGILGAAVLSVSSCLWAAAGSDINTSNESQFQVAHGGPGGSSLNRHQKRKVNRSQRRTQRKVLRRKDARSGARNQVRRNAAGNIQDRRSNNDVEE